MAIKNTFREIAIKMSSKQPQMVDEMLEEAPILGMIPFQPTSDGLQHNYEKVNDVTGAGLVDLDAPLPEVDASTSLDKLDMGIIGGEMFVGEDKAKQLGGPAAYFAGKQDLVLKQTGMDAERSVLYNHLRAFAIENDTTLGGEHAFDAGGVGATNYSIIATKWSPGQISGLYDPAGFGRGTLMDVAPLNGGNLYKHPTKNINGYGIRMKSYFGMLTANKRYVSSVVNIDLENDKLPTETQLDDLIQSVRGQTGGSTFLYMHPKVYTALFQYKASSLELVVGDENINRTFMSWNGIPIMTSYNFMQGNEARVV